MLHAHGEDRIFIVGRGWAVWEGRQYSLHGGAQPALEVDHRPSDIVVEQADPLPPFTVEPVRSSTMEAK